MEWYVELFSELVVLVFTIIHLKPANIDCIYNLLILNRSEHVLSVLFKLNLALLA